MSEVICPKCGSSQIVGQKKGFGLGKAAVGGFVLGPVGLLGGLVGSKKVFVSCMNCGHRWDPASEFKKKAISEKEQLDRMKDKAEYEETKWTTPVMVVGTIGGFAVSFYFLNQIFWWWLAALISLVPALIGANLGLLTVHKKDTYSISPSDESLDKNSELMNDSIDSNNKVIEKNTNHGA